MATDSSMPSGGASSHDLAELRRGALDVAREEQRRARACAGATGAAACSPASAPIPGGNRSRPRSIAWPRAHGRRGARRTVRFAAAGPVPAATDRARGSRGCATGGGGVRLCPARRARDRRSRAESEDCRPSGSIASASSRYFAAFAYSRLATATRPRPASTATDRGDKVSALTKIGSASAGRPSSRYNRPSHVSAGTSSGRNWSARANDSSAFLMSPFSLCRCAR